MSDHEKRMTKDTGDGFLNRWSSRKQEALREESVSSVTAPASEQALVSHTGRIRPDRSSPNHLRPVDAPPILPSNEDSRMADRQEPNAEIELSPESAAAEQDVVMLSDADMPALETLTDKSDVSAFFSKGVSAALRKAALRHVFRQPVYNVRDGLDDYDDDYTYFEPLGETITSDMKFHAARKERARLETLREKTECSPIEGDPIEDNPSEDNSAERGATEGGTSEDNSAERGSTEGGPPESGPPESDHGNPSADDQDERTTKIVASKAPYECDTSKSSDDQSAKNAQLPENGKDCEPAKDSKLLAMNEADQLHQPDGEVMDSDSAITSQSPLKRET